MKLRTPLCDLLGIEVPIIQAGMGWDKEGMTTPPELVAAVSNAGGLGCIGGSSIRPEVIREEIRAVRKLTNRPFGVDITLPKMEDVRIPDPMKFAKKSKKISQACEIYRRADTQAGLDAAAAGSKRAGSKRRRRPASN